MNIKKILGIVVIVGIISFPIVVDNIISKAVVNTKNNLLELGLELNVTKEFGFLSSKRDIQLVVKDADKFFKTLLFKLNSSDFLQKKLAKSFSISKLDDALKGITFTGNIVTNNYIPNKYEINLVLKKLSTKVMNDLSNKKDLQFVLDLLEKEIIKFTILINTNNIDNYTVVLKDIKEEIKIEDRKLFVTLEDNKLLKEDNKYIYTVKKQRYKIKDTDISAFLYMNDFKETYKYDDQFNQFVDISFNDYESFTTHLNIKASKFYIKSKTSSEKTILNNNFLLNIDDFFIKTRRISTSFDKLDFYLDLNGINKASIQQLFTIIEELYTNEHRFFEKRDEISKNALNILNMGFNIKVKLNLKNLKYPDKFLENLNFVIDIKLDKNLISDFESLPKLLEKLDITSQVIINNEEFLKYYFNSVKQKKIISSGIAKNGSILYNIKYQDLVLTINDNKIKL